MYAGLYLYKPFKIAGMKQLIFAATLLGTMLFTQMAEARSRVTCNKQYTQHERIQQGIRSGQVTHREAMQLRMQQAKMRNYRKMAMADGRVNRDERALMHRQQMHNSHNIYDQKHDGQRRHWKD
jgi:hypothetical protein